MCRNTRFCFVFLIFFIVSFFIIFLILEFLASTESRRGDHPISFAFSTEALMFVFIFKIIRPMRTSIFFILLLLDYNVGIFFFIRFPAGCQKSLVQSWSGSILCNRTAKYAISHLHLILQGL